jgi:hypothetical protein
MTWNQVPVTPDPPQLRAAAQELLGSLAQAGAEVLVVAIVAHAVDDQAGTPALSGRREVLEQVPVALFVRLPVVVQVIHVECAVRAPCQETIVAGQHEAPLGEIARLDDGVLVRRDVPVPGCADFETGIAGVSHVGIKKPAFAPVVDRKRKVRGVQDRHALEDQFRPARLAHAFVMPQFQLAGEQLPVRLFAGAGRVIEPVQDGCVPIHQLHALGAAIGDGTREAVVDPGEPTGFLEEGIACLLAPQPDLLILVIDPAWNGDYFGGWVVEDVVGDDVLICAEQLHVAACFSQRLFAGVQLLRIDDDWSAAAVRGRRYRRAEREVRAGRRRVRCKRRRSRVVPGILGMALWYAEPQPAQYGQCSRKSVK